jgi:branched-chain amino acid transport system ATP-binding protein
MNYPLLKIDALQVNYGSITALRDVSLSVFSGELVALIGANGAGKTTLLKSIMGLLPVTCGRVIYQSADITRSPTHRLSPQGLALVPEGRGVFTQMSVLDNLLMGAYHQSDAALIKQGVAQQFELFPRLSERQHQLAGTLSGGEQQMLAIARALMGRPTLLLLDEPSMGLAPLMVKKILDVIQAINREGVSVLLVEQNAHLALMLAGRAYVLEHGSITLQGNAQELLDSPAVKSAYLGF